MPKELALLIGVLFIAWLYVKDRTLRPMTSGALWVPLLWIIVIGSRPVSLWFEEDVPMETPEAYLEGTPLDRNSYLILMIVGLIILMRRKVDWGKISTANRWFLVFMLYCGISLFWSDYPFVGFKRWIKDLGHVIMVLIIITETDPVLAMRAVFSRFTSFAIPLSVVLIKYFPDYGRYYHQFTWQPAYCGISTNKNEFGSILLICGLFLIWDHIEHRAAGEGEGKPGKNASWDRVALLMMMAWLIYMADSSTSLICLIIGGAILYFTRLPFGRRQVRHLGAYSLATVLCIYLLYTVPGTLDALVNVAGRDMSLTGRTDIWADLLQEPVDPIWGTGYQSFWLGPGAKNMWDKYYFHPNQAHNGYLETYLNGGLIGLGLLMLMFIFALSRLKKEIMRGNDFAILLLSILVVGLFYNWTEAVFNRLTLVWLALLMAIMDYPRSNNAMTGKELKPVRFGIASARYVNKASS